MQDRQALAFSREDMREIGYAVIGSLLVEAGYSLSQALALLMAIGLNAIV